MLQRPPLCGQIDGWAILIQSVTLELVGSLHDVQIHCQDKDLSLLVLFLQTGRCVHEVSSTSMSCVGEPFSRRFVINCDQLFGDLIHGHGSNS